MQKNLNKYFWDGAENISGEYKLKRILEYASFPDLITYPIDKLKKFLPLINIETLRTSPKRKKVVKLILPLLAEAQNWDELIDRLVT